MAECIDRQVAIEQIKAEWAKLPLSETTGFGILMRVLTSIPAADVRPVVLCRDCMLRQYCKFAQYLGEDGFCSNGEKSEES